MSKRSQPPGGGGGGLTAPGSKSASTSLVNGLSASSSSAPTATHIYASSIAVPDRASLPRLESRLSEVAMQTVSLLQREVYCARADDDDEARKTIEQDSMYGPIRKARLQSRLRVRFEEGRIDLRLHTKPAGKSADIADVYNLICVPLCNETEDSSSKRRRKGRYEEQINVGGKEWQQVIQSMGWKVRSGTVRRGHRFVIRDDPSSRVEALLFQLFKLDDSSTSLERVSETFVLQVTATLPLVSKTKKSNGQVELIARDASQLSKGALSDIESVQEALNGLVQLAKEEHA